MSDEAFKNILNMRWLRRGGKRGGHGRGGPGGRARRGC